LRLTTEPSLSRACIRFAAGGELSASGEVAASGEAARRLIAAVR
jgi:hypothetical protein